MAATIAIALFVVAIFRLPVPAGAGRLFLLGLFKIMVLVCFAVLLFNINKWACAFLLLAVVSHVWPVITAESQQALGFVLFGLSWFLFVVHFGNDEQLMDVMCVIAFAHFLAVLVQFFKIPSIWGGSVSGLMFNPNAGSALFAVCFSAFLRDGRKRFIPMVIVGLTLISSFNGILAVGVSSVFYGAMVGYPIIIIPAVAGINAAFVYLRAIPTIYPATTIPKPTPISTMPWTKVL